MILHLTTNDEVLDPPFLQATEATALVVEPGVPAVRPGGCAVYVKVDAASTSGESVCAASEGPATFEGRALSCPHHEGEKNALDERVRQAARLDADGVLLELPDAWYAAGARGAGFCVACNARLNAHLKQRHGEQFIPYALTPKLAADEKAPFWRAHSHLRFSSGLEHGARLGRRARDEARAARQAETWVGARLSGLNAAAVSLARKLDFALVPAPEVDPRRVDPAHYDVFRPALDTRPLLGLLDEKSAADPMQVQQAWRLATASGASLVLPAGAPPESREALGQMRRFWKQFQTRYRPFERFAEVLVVYSPECDHWTRGRHGAGVRAVVEALTRVSAQYRIVLGVPRTGSEPLVLADAGALPAEEARHLDARVRDGASVIVVGEVAGVDENGRGFEPPLGERSEGLNTVGQGSAFCIDPKGSPEERLVEPLVLPIDRALDSLLGRGRRAASTNRPSLVVKMYLDPDRKLDVHLVGRAFNKAAGSAEAVQRAVIRLSGTAVGGARSAMLFSPGQKERKVVLTPYDMGVQAQLPDFIGSAVLAVDR